MAWKVETAQDTLAARSALSAAKSRLSITAYWFEEKPKDPEFPLLHLSFTFLSWLPDRNLPFAKGFMYLCPTVLPSPALTTSPHHTVYDLLKLFTFPLVRTHRGLHVLQIFVLVIFLQNVYLTQPIMKVFFLKSTTGSIRDRLPPLWLLFASVTSWVLDFKFHWRWTWTAILIWM